MEKISFDDNLKKVITKANEPKPRFFIPTPIFHIIGMTAARWVATNMVSDHEYYFLPTDIAIGIMSGTFVEIISMMKDKKEIKKANIKITYLSEKLIANGFYVKDDKIKEAIITSETLTKNIGEKTSINTTNDYHMLDMSGKIVVLREYRQTLVEKRRLLKKKNTTVELYALANKDLDQNNLPVKTVPKLLLK